MSEIATDYDVLIVGAGPCGLAAGIAAQQQGLRYCVLDKGNITESVRRYPIDMKFFSTAENIEIGGVPFVSHEMRPTRTEALKYYRKVVDHFNLNLSLFTTVTGVQKEPDGSFVLDTTRGTMYTKHVVLATGYYDIPRYLGIPGEDLPHVSHYYDEPYRYTKTKVLVVGGANSAIEAALSLYRNGAQVTLVHKFEALYERAKYWILPDLENRIKHGQVKAHFETQVKEIHPGKVQLGNLATGEQWEEEADFVFLMTGYRPDAHFLRGAGVQLEGEALIPQIDPITFESNVPGIYIAGSVVGGEETAKIFIENGRHHGQPIMQAIASKVRQMA